MKKQITYERPDAETACDFAIRIGGYMQSAFVHAGTKELIKNALERSHLPFYRNGVSVRLGYKKENGNEPYMYIDIESSDSDTVPKAIGLGGSVVSTQVDDINNVYHSIKKIGNEMQLKRTRGQHEYAKNL